MHCATQHGARKKCSKTRQEVQPEAGALKRTIKNAVTARTKFPVLDINRAGVMHTGGQECARYDANL